MCRRCSRRAWTTCWCPTSRMPSPATMPAPRTTARGTRRCRGCCGPPRRSSREQHRFLIPTLHFQLGPAQVKKGLAEAMRRTRRHAGAPAIARWTRPLPSSAPFRRSCWRPARRALAVLEQTGEPGLVLAGRGYNIYDRGVNCDIPRKLRHRYGANVIPLDFLVTGREPSRSRSNMFWISGRKILEAARIAAEPAQSAHGLHHQFQVRARFVHQALRPRGRRRAAAGPAIRRARQRCRLYDALRSVSGQ